MSFFLIFVFSYRLAPEHPFPAGFDDCCAVVKTLLDTGDEYNIDKDHIVIAGSSAGGNLAAAVTHHLQKENKTLAAQVKPVDLSLSLKFILHDIEKQTEYIFISFVFPQFILFHSVFHSFHGLMNSINWPASSVWVFIAQLVEHCNANTEAMGSNPIEAPKNFFRATSQLVTYSFQSTA